MSARGIKLPDSRSRKSRLRRIPSCGMQTAYISPLAGCRALLSMHTCAPIKWKMEKMRLYLFGVALAHLRKSLGISPYRLAKHSGSSEEYLNKPENSKREPKARMTIRLGRGVPPGDVLNEMDRLMREEEEGDHNPLHDPAEDSSCERRRADGNAPSA